MRRDVQEIFRATPHEKQVMMFSATLSKDIRPVCKKFMQDVSTEQTPVFQTPPSSEQTPVFQTNPSLVFQPPPSSEQTPVFHSPPAGG